MTASVTGVRRARAASPASVLGCAAALGLVLSACGQAEPAPSIPEMEEPPNRELPEPAMLVDAELPVWGHSAACDEPRPAPDGDDGLRIPAPAPDQSDVVFFVPDVELVLCEMPAVVSASLGGSYTAPEGDRDGRADLGLVFEPGAAAEQIEQAWSTGVAEAEAQLDGTGISLGEAVLVLDDGSMIVGPAAGDTGLPLPPDPASAAPAAIPQAIELLPALQETAPQQEAEDSATPPPSPSAQEEEEEAAASERRWTISTGRQLEVTTFFAADLADEDASALLARVLRESGEATAGSRSGEPRHAATVIDGRMELSVPEAQLASLTPELLEDLHELGQVPDLQATARVEGSEEGVPVLRVRSERLPEYSDPDYEDAAAALEISAGAAGLRLDHRLDGEPLPLEDEADAQD